MDIDFPLVLVILSAVTGVIALIDFLWLSKQRKKRAASFEAADKTKDADHDKMLAGLAKEPIVIEYSKSLFPVFFLVLILRSFIGEPFKIPSESMLPTLEIGDHIVVNKFSYGLRLPVLGTKVFDIADPQRGDVMVFKYPENPKINFIKRVVGVPGDKITYKKKRLYVNDVPVDETPLDRESHLYKQAKLYIESQGEAKYTIQKNYLDTGPRKTYTWTVPEGEYFVMGDNRDNSNDSRFWGTVPDELVMGRAFAIWVNRKPGFNLPTFHRNGRIH